MKVLKVFKIFLKVFFTRTKQKETKTCIVVPHKGLLQPCLIQEINMYAENVIS